MENIENLAVRVLTKIKRINHKILSADEIERTARERFVNNIKALDKFGESNERWADHCIELRDCVMNNDIDYFMSWEPLTKTMISGTNKHTKSEYNFLRNHKRWSLWSEVIKEKSVGCHPPFLYNSKASGTAIRHAGHLAHYEDATGKTVDQFDLIIEFGGGFGSLSRVCYASGFTGKYVIYDLPHFSQLQQYYLESNNFKATQNPEELDQAQVYLSSSIDAIQKLVDSGKYKNILFASSAAFSEVPVDLREKFQPILEKINNFLFLYQSKFMTKEGKLDYDNVAEFKNLQAELNHVEWKHEPINSLDENYYLFA